MTLGWRCCLTCVGLTCVGAFTGGGVCANTVMGIVTARVIAAIPASRVLSRVRMLITLLFDVALPFRTRRIERRQRQAGRLDRFQPGPVSAGAEPARIRHLRDQAEVRQ